MHYMLMFAFIVPGISLGILYTRIKLCWSRHSFQAGRHDYRDSVLPGELTESMTSDL